MKEEIGDGGQRSEGGGHGGGQGQGESVKVENDMKKDLEQRTKRFARCGIWLVD